MSAILDGKHDEVLSANRIDNPRVALANPIEMVQALELRDAGGTDRKSTRLNSSHG